MIGNVEFTTDLSKEAIMSRISDPIFVVGSLGHVAILRIFDDSINDYAIPSQAKMSNYGKFHVAYLFGSGKAWIKAGGGVRAKEGFLEGPLYSPMGVTYVGSIMNEEMRFEVNMSVNKLPSTTSVRIMYNVDEKSNFWQRIAGFSFYDLVDHVVKGHLVAVLSNYPIMKRTC